MSPKTTPTSEPCSRAPYWVSVGLLYFDSLGATQRQDSQDSRYRQSRQQRLVCRRCANRITTIQQRIRVSASHQHQFTNPANQQFVIGCFSAAPGCSLEGLAWAEHSWFPGHSWTVALCHRCSEHLGWYFQGSQTFFGLILDRLQIRD